MQIKNSSTVYAATPWSNDIALDRNVKRCISEDYQGYIIQNIFFLYSKFKSVNFKPTSKCKPILLSQNYRASAPLQLSSRTQSLIKDFHSFKQTNDSVIPETYHGYNTSFDLSNTTLSLNGYLQDTKSKDEPENSTSDNIKFEENGRRYSNSDDSLRDDL